MIAVLLPAIKTDLGLTDFQSGLITGLFFTIFYATLGIPIARLADRRSRRVIISAALAVWSFMTAMCGLAQNFVQLAIARVMVGVGEAGCSPPSHSLIADLFPPERRAQALSLFTIGAPVGIFVGFQLGGILSEHYSWRIALFVVAVPGLALALVMYLKLPEPKRGAADHVSGEIEQLPLWPTFVALAKNASFRHVAFATGLYTILWLGVTNFIPSFFSRSFDQSISSIGTNLAFILGGSQIVGMLVGGALADRLGRRDARWYAWVPALALLVSSPIFIVTFTTSDLTIAYLSLIGPFTIGIMQGPASFAIVQGIVDVGMRATASALFLLIVNLVGGAIGAPLVGFISDWLTPQYGIESLRYALLIVAVASGMWAALHYALAGRTIRKDFRVHATA